VAQRERKEQTNPDLVEAGLIWKGTHGWSLKQETRWMVRFRKQKGVEMK
jgi:hypothetical protein